MKPTVTSDATNELVLSLHDSTGIILAGGESIRWGRPKSEVIWRGRMLMQHAVERLRTVCREVIAVARREQDGGHWPVDRVVYDDPSHPAGPLRGIVSGLSACRTPFAFIISCDAPGIQPELLVALRGLLAPGRFGVVPEWEDHIQPLVALYAVAALRSLEDSLRRGEQSPTRAVAALPFGVLPDDECRRVDPSGLSFVNLNTPGDLIRLEHLLAPEPADARHVFDRG